MNQLLKEKVDILENTIYKIDKELLEILLLDRTTKENIRWCTNNYIKHGFEYSFLNQFPQN